MNDLTIAICQWELVWHNAEANRKLAEHFLLQAGKGTDLVVFPEMFTTGFTMEPALVAEPFEGKTLDWMTKWASKIESTLMGSWVVGEKKAFWNRLAAVSADDIEVEYNKRHLFGLAGENKHYQKGKEWVCFELKGWRISPQICYDLRFPVWSRNRTMTEDHSLMYDVLVYVANWPEARIHHWDALLKSRAIENQAFVIGVNRVGTDENGHNYPGHSTVIDPTGKELVKMGAESGVSLVRLDRSLLENYRKQYPFWKDTDNFDLYP